MDTEISGQNRHCKQVVLKRSLPKAVECMKRKTTFSESKPNLEEMGNPGIPKRAVDRKFL